MNTLDKIREECSGLEIEVIDRGNGHIQLKGKLLVNYYPNTKKCSAYVAGTRKAETHVTIQRAIEMTYLPPDVKPYKKRRRNTKPIRQKMLKKSTACHWCGNKLTLNTSTLEHIIPLHRGGLDNENNMALACPECNQKRGHNMPELEAE